MHFNAHTDYVGDFSHGMHGISQKGQSFPCTGTPARQLCVSSVAKKEILSRAEGTRVVWPEYWFAKIRKNEPFVCFMISFFVFNPRYLGKIF